MFYLQPVACESKAEDACRRVLCPESCELRDRKAEAEAQLGLALCWLCLALSKLRKTRCGLSAAFRQMQT